MTDKSMARIDPNARALALFDEYAEMPHATLSKALASLQSEDAEVCAALMRMLAADEQTHVFFSPLRWFARQDPSGTDGVSPDRIWPDGTRLGPWCIDGIIGLGGMGIVYAAHRADGLYERDVALKTIRTDVTSPALQQAFGKERSHLAKLEHPSIVTLHDAGVSDSGQPWLAMQRVHGEAIDRWCDLQRADLRSRMRLLVDVCDAVGYAHAHGVLHQDIKPSNLLVTDAGQVKLLDFGLSAMLTPYGDGGFTRIGVSSAFAAQEVFDGAPPSVAIDVHALGVVLYRLLCDRWPRPQRSLLPLPVPYVDVVQAPSVLALDTTDDVSQARNQRNSAALSRALRGDLDAIALRCVRDDPVERYPSVADLRADLLAWLQRRPVAASDGGWLYRGSRFVRRNAMAVGAVGLLVSATTVGGVSAWRQQERTRLEEENTETLSRLFAESLGAATLNSLGSRPAEPSDLLRDAERRLRSMAGDERPRLLARGLVALAHGYTVRADFVAAERLLLESKRVGENDPLQTATSNAALANLFNKGARLAEAERLASEGLDVLPERDGIDDDLLKIELQFQLARSRWLREDASGALPILDRAIVSARRIGPLAQVKLASLLRQRATIRNFMGNEDDAEQDLREALSYLDDDSPTVLSQVRQTLALLSIARGDTTGGHRLAALALQSSLRVFGPMHAETGRAWLTIAKSWRSGRRDPRRAGIALGQAETIFVRRFGADHPMLDEVISLRASLAMENGAEDDGVALMRRAVAISAGGYGCCVEGTLRRRHALAQALVASARSLRGGAREAAYSDAEAVLAKVLQDGERHGVRVGYAHAARVAPLLFDGDVAEAERQALMALEIASGADDESVETVRDDMDEAIEAMLRVRLAQKRHGDAAALLESLRGRLPPQRRDPDRHFRWQVLRLEIDMSREDREAVRAQQRRLQDIAKRYGFEPRLQGRIDLVGGRTAHRDGMGASADRSLPMPRAP
jgi:serine/threonine-protein kinase